MKLWNPLTTSTSEWTWNKRLCRLLFVYYSEYYSVIPCRELCCCSRNCCWFSSYLVTLERSLTRTFLLLFIRFPVICQVLGGVPEIARGNLGCLTNNIRASPSSRAVLLLAELLLVYVVYVVVYSFPCHLSSALALIRRVSPLKLLKLFQQAKLTPSRTPAPRYTHAVWGISFALWILLRR